MKKIAMNALLVIVLLAVGIHFVIQINNNNNVLAEIDDSLKPLSYQQQVDYMKQVFAQADSFRYIKFRDQFFYHVFQDTVPVGYAKIIDKDLACSTCRDVRYLCALDSALCVKEVILISELDQKRIYDKILHLEDGVNRVVGKKVFNIVNLSDFVSQFISTLPSDKIFNKDAEIDVISGATKTSHSMYEGIREFLDEAAYYSRQYHAQNL